MNGRHTILHLRSASGSGGGADVVLHDIAARLDRDAFRVIVCYLRKHGSDISSILHRLASSGIACHDLPGGRLYDRRQFRQLVRIVSENHVQVVHSHDDKSDFYGYLLRRRFPAIRFVSTVHGWNHPSWKGWIYDRLDKHFLKRYDAVIAVSRDIEKTARRHGLMHVRLQRNAVDTEHWRKADSAVVPAADHVTTIGFIGRFSPEKGPLDFVRLAARLTSPGRTYRFVMAGTGPEQARVTDLVARLALCEHFVLPGQLDQAGLLDLYQHLDVLVLPSYTEGIPLTILEALAMEVPVVATRVGGVGDVVRPGISGLLCAPGDIAAMARHVKSLQGDPALAATFRHQGRELVEREFSLHKNVLELAALYREARRPSPPSAHTCLRARIKPLLKSAWAHAWFDSGLLAMRGWLRDRWLGTSPTAILTLHRVVPHNLRDQIGSHPAIVVEAASFLDMLEFLHARYRVISLADFARAMQTGSRLAPKTVVLTFDDGWADNYSHALPGLREFSLPATIFVSTGYIDASALFWQEQGVLRIKNLMAQPLTLQACFDQSGVTGFSPILAMLANPATHSAGVAALINKMMHLDDAGRAALLDSLATACPDPGPACEHNSFLSWEQAAEMREQGIDFGAHGVRHLLLDRIPADQAMEEIRQSKQAVETHLPGKPCVFFAYPNGNFSDRTIAQLKSAGYQAAVTTQAGLNRVTDDPFRLKRINICEDRLRGPSGRFSRALLAARLSGIL